MEKSCATCKHGKPKPSWGLNEIYCYSPKLHLNNKDADGNPCDFTHLTRSCNCHEPKKETPTKMDKQTAIINHRHMWGWLSENPEKEKIDYMVTYNIKPGLYNECFLCEYHDIHSHTCGSTCILKWPGDNCMSGLFGEWKHTTDLLRRAELARQIRDLPERREILNLTPADNTPFKAAMKEHSPPPKLTRSEAIAKTREQWGWLNGNPNRTKAGYFESLNMPGEDIPMYACYLCEYTRSGPGSNATRDTCGKDCPLQWPGGCCVLDDRSGLYQMWGDNKGKYLCSLIADLIANLPEQEELSPEEMDYTP